MFEYVFRSVQEPSAIVLILEYYVEVHKEYLKLEAQTIEFFCFWYFRIVSQIRQRTRQFSYMNARGISPSSSKYSICCPIPVGGTPSLSSGYPILGYPLSWPGWGYPVLCTPFWDWGTPGRIPCQWVPHPWSGGTPSWDTPVLTWLGVPYQLSWYFEWCIQWCTTSQGSVPWQPKGVGKLYITDTPWEIPWQWFCHIMVHQNWCTPLHKYTSKPFCRVICFPTKTGLFSHQNCSFGWKTDHMTFFSQLEILNFLPKSVFPPKIGFGPHPWPGGAPSWGGTHMGLEYPPSGTGVLPAGTWDQSLG